MSCRDVTERASDFVDGTLPWPERLQIRLHLMMCRFCRAYVRQIALIARTLHRLPPEAPPPDVEKDLLDAFRAERK